MQFDGRQSDQSLLAMKREFQSILKPLHLRFNWRMLGDGSETESFPNLVVVKFKGWCGMDGRLSSLPAAGSLAFTHSANDKVLPFIDVECDRIRTMVGATLRVADNSRREYILGRALGRVLAHEFRHVFERTKEHGQGLMKASFSAEDLVSDRFPLR